MREMGMRCVWLCLGILLGSGSTLLANPIPESKQTEPAVSRAEAQRFARQLTQIIDYVGEKYIRRVPRAEVATPALKGLYEAAETPVPSNLANQVRGACDSQDLPGFIERTRVRLRNPEGLRGHKAIRASLQGMLEALDPYCGILTDAEAGRSLHNTLDQGIGLELEDDGIGPLVVKNIALGGPAQKAGLCPGDRITMLDGRPVGSDPATRSLAAAQKQLIRLTYWRPSQPYPRKAELQAEMFSPQTVLGVSRRSDNEWDYFLDPFQRIALVRIPAALSSSTTLELLHALDQAQQAGLRGLILDLRWCPGGRLDASRIMAEMFIGEHSLAYLMMPVPGNVVALADIYLGRYYFSDTVQYRGGRIDKHSRASDGRFNNFPMIVLVNGETSGGAELVAAVLQDNFRALIAGQRTRGKATVQSLIDLGAREVDGDIDPNPIWRMPLPDAHLKLTTGMFVRPNLKNLHRLPGSKASDDWGVRPDRNLEFRISPELGHQLQEWWLRQSLRPHDSIDVLPLDDRGADPQLQAALRALLRLVKS
jgi:carboxyl-terminal processing protease